MEKLMQELQALDREAAILTAEKQALFRLGQKDMQQSILDMVRGLAAAADGVAHITLASLAEMISKIEVEP